MRINTYITYKKSYEEDKQVDLLFRSNALNIINIYCYDEDDLLVDISGAAVTFLVKSNPTDKDDDAIINKTITDLTNPACGNTLIEVEKLETENLVGNYIYELRIALAESGNEYILNQGNICFMRSIYGIES